jgi:hypothetical protein
MSLVSGSGTSMAAKWPPRSYSDQCSILPSGSMRLRIVVSAAKTATPVGGSDTAAMLALYLGLLDADFQIDESAAPELAECLRTLSARYARATYGDVL